MAAISTGIGDAGSGPALGGDFSGELGSLLGDAFDSATSEGGGESAPGGEGGESGGQPQEGTFDTPGGEAPTPLDTQPATQHTQQQPEVAPQSAEPFPGWKLNADGQTYSVPKTHLPQVQSAINYANKVGQYFSNPQEAQAASEQASSFRQMSNDLIYGTDESIVSVMDYLSGINADNPTSRQALQRSFVKMAQRAPEYLQRIDPQAHQQFIQSTSKALVSSLYERAAQTGNPNDLLNAQAVDWGMNGRYEAQPPRQDPAALAQSRFQQERQAFEQRQNNALNRDVGNYFSPTVPGTETLNPNSVEGAKISQLDARIDKHLESIKSRYPEVAYADLRNGIRSEIVGQLKGSDWWTEHRQHFDQLVADYRHTWNQGAPGNGLQPRIQAYQNDFLSRAARVLPSIAQKRVNATTQAQTASRSSARPGTRQQPGSAAPTNGAPAPNGRANGSNGNGQSRISRDQWDQEWAQAFK